MNDKNGRRRKEIGDQNKVPRKDSLEKNMDNTQSQLRKIILTCLACSKLEEGEALELGINLREAERIYVVANALLYPVRVGIANKMVWIPWPFECRPETFERFLAPWADDVPPHDKTQLEIWFAIDNPTFIENYEKLPFWELFYLVTAYALTVEGYNIVCQKFLSWASNFESRWSTLRDRSIQAWD